MNKRRTWKTIKGFSRYQINQYGEIRNTQTGRILKHDRTTTGYLAIKLMPDNGGPSVKFYVHRLVMSVFVPVEDDSAYIVHHLDGVRSNPRLDNLERVSALENMRHKYADRQPVFEATQKLIEKYGYIDAEKLILALVAID